MNKSEGVHKPTGEEDTRARACKFPGRVGSERILKPLREVVG